MKYIFQRIPTDSFTPSTLGTGGFHGNPKLSTELKHSNLEPPQKQLENKSKAN
jgi:hypothetical protein